MTLINPIFSEWKSVGLEQRIPMITFKALKKFVVGGWMVWYRVIIVSALSLSL